MSSGSALAQAPCTNFVIPQDPQCAGGNCGSGTPFTSSLAEQPGRTYRYEWDFGDPDSGPANTSELKQPNHSYSQPGTYTVSVKVFVDGVEDATLGCSGTVTVQGIPEFKILAANQDINLGPQEEEVCIENLTGPGVELSAQVENGTLPAGATYQWSNGSTDPKLLVKEEGCYSVEITATVNGVTCSRTNRLQVYGYKPAEDGPNVPPPQQQARWYFGNGAGVKFQGNPQAVAGGAVNTPEGSSTVLDRKGNLLFYTDGRTVYDTVGVALPNGTGLAGGPNSTQAVLIVPQPGCNDCTPTYYVFTTGDITATGSRLEYNVVDMTQNGGKGAVDPNQKNQLLTPNSTERIISIRGQSDPQAENPVETTWIITHDYAGTFRIYPLTPAGLGAPKTYPGAAHSSPENGEGYMKSFQYTDTAGVTSTRIAVVVPGAAGQNNKVEIFDFDPTTGAVSGPVTTVDLADPDLKAYGVEFAGDYMYVSLVATPPDSSKIVRYDLNPDAGLTVDNTREEVVKDQVRIGALQAGPDGQIYVAVEGATSLWSIASPRAPTAAEVGLNRNAIQLNGPTSNLGLPTNAEPENKGYGQSFSFEQPACALPGTDYTIQFSANPDRAPRNDGTPNSFYAWTFHDGTTSNLQNPTKAYRSPGRYLVDLTITNDCRVEELDSQYVEIFEAPPPIALPNFSACFGSPVRLEVYPGLPGPTGVRYTWIMPDGTTRSGKAITVTSADAVPGVNVYRVVVSNENCSETGISQINFTQPTVDLGPDISECKVTTIALNAGIPGLRYQWFRDGQPIAGQTQQVLRVTLGTTAVQYMVRVTDPLTTCSNADTIVVRGGVQPTAGFDSAPPNACDAENGNIRVFSSDADAASYRYEWFKDGVRLPVTGTGLDNASVGIYQIRIINSLGCETTLTVPINVPDAVPAPKIQPIDPVTLPCEGEVTILPTITDINPDLQFEWKNADNETISSEDRLTIPQDNIGPGVYTLTVTDLATNCKAVAVAEVLANPNQPEVVIANNPNGCGRVFLQALLTEGNLDPANFTYKWFIEGNAQTVLSTNDTLTVSGVNQTVNYVVEVKSADGCLARSTTSISFPVDAPVNVGGPYLAVCAPNTVLLNPPADPNWDTYIWTLPGTGNRNFVGRQFNTGESGTYTLTVRNSRTGCQKEATVNVTINPAPGAPTVTNPNVTICSDQELPRFTATGTGLNWYGDQALTQPLSTNAVFQPTNVDRNVSRSYTYYVTQTVGGCPSPATTVTLTINVAPIVELGPNRNVCQGETVVLNAAPTNNVTGATYRWENNLTTPTLNATRSGTYRVTVTLGTCVVRDSVTLTFVAPPETSIPRRTVPLCINDAAATATLDGGPGASFTYEWRKLGSPAVLGTTRTIIINSRDSNLGRYIVSIGNGGSCTRNDTINVIAGCEPTVFVPDAFAPAGNLSENQRLFVFGKYVGDIQMLIYNRWGELIYAQKGDNIEVLRNTAWDGTYLGRPAPTGTYAWKITYRSADFPDREPVTLRGAVLLMR